MITKQQDKALQELGYTGGMAMDIDKAIRWMRDVKGVHVSVDYFTDFNWVFFMRSMPDGKKIKTSTGFNSHDLAQSAGLDAAIEYVKKQQNKL